MDKALTRGELNIEAIIGVSTCLSLEVLLDIRDLLAKPTMTAHDEEVVKVFTGSKPTTSQEEV